MKKIDPLEVVGTYGSRIDASAVEFLTRNDYALYGMMRYFMGYTDEHLNVSSRAAGKRMRPGLMLLIADSYGLLEEAIPAALSIELFHNFTLIHDDIVDHDELRRGRPTVWKLWGVDHAINTGDAQLILALRALEKSELMRIPHSRTTALRTRLLDRYLEVIEGQYLDFTLTAAKLNAPSVTEEAYLLMTEKKTSKLIRAATETTAILAGLAEEKVTALGDFGGKLGMAYQLYDDWQGIWGVPEKTGKRRAGDIYERKKTLPVIHAYMHLNSSDKKRLEELYDNDNLDEAMVAEVLDFFSKTDAQKILADYAARYKREAVEALSHTELAPATKKVLEQVTTSLVPDMVAASR